MLFRAFGLRAKPLPAQTRAKLPQLRALVELTVLGGGPRGSVSFEELRDGSFTVEALRGMQPGQTGVFSYQNRAGRFRFSAKCASVHGHQAVFSLPQRIETVQLFEGTHQRAAVRLEATLPAQWRFALGGKGQGDFLRASLTDISRTGASLIVDRDMRRGTTVEVRFSVTTSSSPLQLLAEVMRTSKIEASGKVELGLRFNGCTPEEDRAIMDFINKRQAERRSRGLA
jgi:hypothetical protein